MNNKILLGSVLALAIVGLLCTSSDSTKQTASSRELPTEQVPFDAKKLRLVAHFVRGIPPTPSVLVLRLYNRAATDAFVNNHAPSKTAQDITPIPQIAIDTKTINWAKDLVLHVTKANGDSATLSSGVKLAKAPRKRCAAARLRKHASCRV